MSTPPAPALDAIIAKALAPLQDLALDITNGVDLVRAASAAVREALLAEGTIHAPDENSVTQWHPFLAIPLEPAS